MRTATSASVPEGHRILHIVASGGLYGVERMLLALLPALRERGHDIRLLSLNVPGTAGARLPEILRARGVPVEFAYAARGLSVGGLWRLYRSIRRHRPDLVHLHGYKATILAGLLAGIGRMPAVATFHTEAKRAVGLDTYVRIETRVLRRLRAVVAVSEPIRAELRERGVRADRIQVIPNGIEDSFDPGARGNGERSTNAGPRLLFVGRLVEGKNVDLLIQAVADLRTEFPALELEIAGDGPERSDLEARARDLGVQDRVRFLGFVEDVPLSRCDCFVLPSRTEGMPISVLEAMSAGLPILTTTVGSVPSVVRDGREAMLVPPDRRDALVSGLRAILADPGLQRRLGSAARRRFELEYTAGRMAERYAEFYDRILAGGRPPGSEVTGDQRAVPSP